MKNGQYSPAQLDAMAREMGYRNYQEWSLYEKKRSEKNTNAKVVKGKPAAKKKPQRNFFQRLNDGLAGRSE